MGTIVDTSKFLMPLQVPRPHPFVPSLVWRVTSKCLMSSVAAVSHFWMHYLNKTYIYNRQSLTNAIDHSPRQPIVTVCNHTSCLDDPILWGATLDWNHIFKNCMHLMRWSMAASDVCFTKPSHAKFFAVARGVPAVRGDGVYQQGMDFVLKKLNERGWAHTFPEGKINVDSKNVFLRLKWGVGRLVAEADITPKVIPFWHCGMDDILPNKRPYIPQTGKIVTIVIGEAMDFSKLIMDMKYLNESDEAIRKAITDQIQSEFLQLKIKAESLHDENILQK